MKSFKSFSLYKLLSSCLHHLFSSQQATSRESSIFGGPTPDMDSISNVPASDVAFKGQNNALPCREACIYPYRSSGPMELTLNKLQTVRVWCHNYEPYPMRDITDKGLDDVVYVAVPLQDSRDQSISGNRISHPQGAILVDLAICTKGVDRVRRAYGPIDFVPLSDDDPIIKAQSGSNSEFKKSLGYALIHRKYLQIYSKYCHLAEVLGCEINKSTREWFDESMGSLGQLLVELGPS